MNIDEVITYYRHNLHNVSRALGISAMSVCKWRKNGQIPIPYQCMLELVSNGKLKANLDDYFKSIHYPNQKD